MVLCSAPILAKPHFDKPFILDTDASQCAVGAILSQIGCDEQEHPIFYYSRVLTPAEKNYSVTEKECLAMVTAVSKFRAYILGNRTTIRTDHAPIMGLLWGADLTGRCVRWQCLLSEYELILQTRSGKTHQNADGLSRMLTKGGLKLANAIEGQEDELAFAALGVRGPDRFLHSAWYRDIMETMFQHPEGEEEYRLGGGRLLHRGTDGCFRICLLEHEVPSAIA